MTAGNQLWNLPQALVWICCSRGEFATESETEDLIVWFRPEDGRSDKSMGLAHARLLQLPRVQADRVEVEVGMMSAKMPVTLVGQTLNDAWGAAGEGLLAATRGGELTIFARPKRNRGKLEVLDALHCAQLVFRDEHGADGAYACYPDDIDHAWDMVRFKAQEIRARWRRPKLLFENAKPSRRVAQARLLAFLAEIADPHKTQPQIRELATSHFEGCTITQAQWRKAWKALPSDKKRARGDNDNTLKLKTKQ